LLYLISAYRYDYASNIYRYDVARQAVSQVSAFTEEFVRALSVSPDGQYVVFELETELASDLPPDLWVMRLDGSGLRLLMQSARAPGWSR
jgi:Tol biopolymer transport system component